MVHLTSLLVAVLSLGAVISAAPQKSTSATKPVATATAANAPKNATIEELEAHPMKFPAMSAAVQPIPGGSSNKTLIIVVPQLQEIVNGSTKPSTLVVREDGLEKRFRCDNQLNPWAWDWMWNFYSDSFCNFYFPGNGPFYVAAGFCFTGNVPAFPPWPKLEFTYCAKNPGVPYPTFVAITNAICKAQFKGIVTHDDTFWNCPAFSGNSWAGRVHGGDNFDTTTDASNWQLKAV